MAIGPQAEQRQRLLLAVLLLITIFVGIVLYNRYGKSLSLQVSLPSLPDLESSFGPLDIPFDVFTNDRFLNLKRYTPLSPPQVERRANPFISQ